MQRIRKKSDRVLAMLLSLIMLIGMLPLSTLTAFAAETGEDEIYTITLTSNNMEKFKEEFDDMEGKKYTLGRAATKEQGVYVYSLPQWTGERYKYKSTTATNYDVVTVRMNNDLDSFSLIYNGVRYDISVDQLLTLEDKGIRRFVTGGKKLSW